VKRVLVTGAAGGFGAALVARLDARDDVHVVGLDVRTPDRSTYAGGAEFVRGDIRDPDGVERAMRGCDVVAHLAWVVGSMHDEQARDAIDLGGTANVLAAMARTGCGRLVFASSVTAYGSVPDHPEPYTEADPLRADQPSAYASHKAQAEALIADAGVEAVLPRAAVVVGRAVDNAVRNVFAAPMIAAIRGDEMRVQVVHQDDVARFYEDACVGTRIGAVNLAAPDVIGIEEAAQILGKRVVRLPAGVVKAFVRATWTTRLGAMDPGEFNSMRYLPLVDVSRLHDEWGFVPEYSTTAALADFRTALDGVVGVGRWIVRRPGRRLGRPG
jgi:nucleoside-diphosphate-sugar epimerase